MVWENSELRSRPKADVTARFALVASSSSSEKYPGWTDAFSSVNSSRNASRSLSGVVWPLTVIGPTLFSV